MLKVLIVEDEDFERRALKFLINKYYLEKCVVIGESSNGKDALDKSLILNPDIIIMDINMPIMDGLEASEKIKIINKDVEIIISTAYDYFDYAKKALTCGVSDYLVKPFQDKDFIDSFDKVIKKIQAKNIGAISQQNVNDNFNKAIPFIEKELITKIAYGSEYTEEEIKEGMKLLGIDSLHSSCILIGNNSGERFKEESISSVKNYLSHLFSRVIGSKFLGDMVFFVFDSQVENIMLSSKIEDIFNKIELHFQENENMIVNITTGPHSAEIGGYTSSYNQARSLFRTKEENIIDTTPTESKNLFNIDDKENILSSKIINEDLAGALKEAKLLMDNLIKNSLEKDLSILKQDIMEIISKIKNNILDFVGSEHIDINEVRILKELDNLNTYNDINNYLNIFIKDAINDISNYKNSTNINIITQAKKYIDNNYMKDIRLEDVSQLVNISSYYFSRIFKKFENVNYIQYLTKVRMEKAKELIIDDRLSIKEIAIKVGFMDQNYFSRAFKKYVGESPTEFSLKHKSIK